jgi:hypothetical protein
LPASPVALNIVDVAGNLQLTKEGIERFRAANPKLVSRINYAQAPSPELPGKLKAQQSAGRDKACGYCRVDWFTPDGLPTWGDGRLTVAGTEGTIELRKYLDIEGRPGTDDLFLTSRSGTNYVSCADVKWTYFAAFARDCRDRTDTAMTQRHVFTVCRLALAAQAGAEQVALPGGLPH